MAMRFPLILPIFVGLEMQKFMKSAGWNIAPYQGNDAWILPTPATFIVGPIQSLGPIRRSRLQEAHGDRTSSSML